MVCLDPIMGESHINSSQAFKVGCAQDVIVSLPKLLNAGVRLHISK
jgi:hypothetical protein